MSALNTLHANYSLVTTAVESAVSYDHPVYYADAPADHWAMTAFIDLFWYIIATIISCICCVSFVLLFYIQQTRRYQSKHSHRSTDHASPKRMNALYTMTRNPCHPRNTPRRHEDDDDAVADGTPSHQMSAAHAQTYVSPKSPFSPKRFRLPFSPKTARSDTKASMHTNAALPTLTVTSPHGNDIDIHVDHNCDDECPLAVVSNPTPQQTVCRNTAPQRLPKAKGKGNSVAKPSNSKKQKTSKKGKGKVIYKGPKRARNVALNRLRQAAHSAATCDSNAASNRQPVVANTRRFPASHHSTSSSASSSSSGTAISTTCSSTISSHTTVDMDVHPRDAASTVQTGTQRTFQPHVQNTSIASATSAASYSATMTFSHHKNPQSLSAFSGVDSDGIDIDVTADPDNVVFHELHPIPESIHEASHSWASARDQRNTHGALHDSHHANDAQHGHYAAVRNGAWRDWRDEEKHSRPAVRSEEQEEEEEEFEQQEEDDEEDGSSEGCDDEEESDESESEQDRPRARHTQSRKLKTLQQQMEFAKEFVYEQQQAFSQYVLSPRDSKPRCPDSDSSGDEHVEEPPMEQEEQEEAANEQTRQNRHMCQETPLSVFTAISSVSAAMARFETNAVFPNGMTSLNAEPSVQSEDDEEFEEEEDDDDEQDSQGEDEEDGETSVDSDQNTIIAMMKKRSNFSTMITVNSALSGTTNYFEKPGYKFSHDATETTVHSRHSDPRGKHHIV